MNLPAGLIDNSSAELFAFGNSAGALKGGIVIDITDSIDMLTHLREALENDTKALEAIEARTSDPVQQIVEFVRCRFGDFDQRADYDLEHGVVLNNHEYWSCPKRGNCPDEGVVCILPSGPGGTLTPREIEVVKLITEGLLDKEIADQLNIALSTAETHRRNIQHKLLTYTKSAVTRFAMEHNIIKA